MDSGYQWKKAARFFLSQQEDGEVKVLALTRSILQNIEKQVEFYFRCVARASLKEKLNYDAYKALRRSVIKRQSDNMSRAFRVHGTWRKRDEARNVN